MPGSVRRVFLASISLICLEIESSAAFAGGPGRLYLQPAEDTSGVVLRIDGDRVSDVRAGGRAVFRLRSGESLRLVAETADGWLAAGGVERDRSHGILLVAARGGGARRLVPPPALDGALRLRPVPLLERGELVGLAWLEGDDIRRLEVRAAARRGDGWGPVETVAGPAAGSQTGLTGGVLADGTWLLVWSAYDGGDDEIVWSARRGGTWSPPDRLHPGNEVPDVAPAVLGEGDGATAAWSRLEGEEYATAVARFDGGGWSTADIVARGGALYPSFHRDLAATRLIVRSAFPAGWTVLELDATGEVARRARFDVPAPERPAVLRDTGGAVTLAWPDGGRREVASWESVR